MNRVLGFIWEVEALDGSPLSARTGRESNSELIGCDTSHDARYVDRLGRDDANRLSERSVLRCIRNEYDIIIAPPIEESLLNRI